MKKTGAFLIALFAALAVFAMPLAPAAHALAPTGFTLSAESALLLSLDTGKTVFEKNADEKLYPASLTKIMTAVLAIESGKDLDKTVVTVKKADLNLLIGTDSSVVGLKAGEELTLRTLLYMLLVRSANDAANVIADEIGGSIPKFIDMMNAKANELGMAHTRYVNAHGLHDPGHYTTARDMSVLAQYAMKLPLFPAIVSTAAYYTPADNKSEARKISNTNLLLNPASGFYMANAYGIKTGSTSQAGECLISAAAKGGFHYLCIVMKCPSTDPDTKKPSYDYFQDTVNLYTWIFSQFTYKQVVAQGAALAAMPVELCLEQTSVKLYAGQDLSAMLPTQADASSIITGIHLNRAATYAPVKAGDVMGYATFTYAGEEIGRVDLVTKDNLNRSMWLFVWQQAVKDYHSLLFRGLAALIAALFILWLVLRFILGARGRRALKVRNFTLPTVPPPRQNPLGNSDYRQRRPTDIDPQRGPPGPPPRPKRGWGDTIHRKR